MSITRRDAWECINVNVCFKVNTTLFKKGVLMMLVCVWMVPLSTCAAENENYTPYVVCPLDNNPVWIVKDAPSGPWKIEGNSYNISNSNNNNNNNATSASLSSIVQAKPCWCVSLGEQYPAFCPSRFDACRVVNGVEVTCLNLDSKPSFVMEWLVPFVGPFVLLIYGSLLLSCCWSRRGLATRDFIMKHVVSGCGYWYPERYDQWMEWTVQNTSRRFPDWAHHLMQVRILQEQEQWQTRGGQHPPWVTCTQLELKTRRYRKTTTNHYSSNCMLQTVTLLSNKNSEEMDHIKDHSCIEQDIDEETGAAFHGVTSTSQDFDMEENDHDDITCAICCLDINEGDRIGNIPCHHLFHVNCLKSWLKRKNKCPICSANSVASPKL